MTSKQTVSFLLLLLIPSFFFPPVQNFTQHVRLTIHGALEPVWATVQFVSENLHGGTRHVGELITAYRDYQLLSKEVQSLRQEVQTLREIEKENDRLSALLELKKSQPSRSLVGHVITRNISHWFRWVVIDLGREDGVLDRMVLINEDGVVGRVMGVGQKVSECILLTDPESNVSGMLQSSRAVGLVSGEGRNDRLRMSRIPSNAEVNIGDWVLTAGLGGVYPKGLTIGQVTMVGAEDDGMHLFAYLKPAVDFNSLEEVLCIASYHRDSSLP